MSVDQTDPISKTIRKQAAWLSVAFSMSTTIVVYLILRQTDIPVLYQFAILMLISALSLAHGIVAWIEGHRTPHDNVGRFPWSD